MLTALQIKQYRHDNPFCEVWQHIPREDRKKLNYFCRDSMLMAGSIHHIALGPSKRKNELTNIIHLNEFSHGFWTHKHPVEGFVLCCWVKAQKGELDWDVMGEIMGKNLPGYLETDYLTGRIHMDWIHDLRKELISGVIQ